MGLLGSRGAPMTAWSRERPTQPGWYWWRNLNLKYEEDRGPFIYYVRDYVGKMSVSNCNVEGSPFDKGEWQGPLEPKE